MTASQRETTNPPEVIVDWLSGHCPVQSEGSIAGVPFYFRARGARWMFYVGTDPLSDTSWSTGGPYGEGYEAGWMELDDARALIARAAGLWLAEQEPEPSATYAAYLEAELAWEAELRRSFGRETFQARYNPEGRGENGSKLRELNDARIAAFTIWANLTTLPVLVEKDPEA